MHAIQDMPRNFLVSSPDCIRLHFASGVDKTYIRVPIDGFACGQEVNNLADGPVDQLSMNEILKVLLVKRSVGHLESTLP